MKMYKEISKMNESNLIKSYINNNKLNIEKVI